MMTVSRHDAIRVVTTLAMLLASVQASCPGFSEQWTTNIYINDCDTGVSSYNLETCSFLPILTNLDDCQGNLACMDHTLDEFVFQDLITARQKKQILLCASHKPPVNDEPLLQADITACPCDTTHSCYDQHTLTPNSADLRICIRVDQTNLKLVDLTTLMIFQLNIPGAISLPISGPTKAPQVHSVTNHHDLVVVEMAIPSLFFQQSQVPLSIHGVVVVVEEDPSRTTRFLRSSENAVAPSAPRTTEANFDVTVDLSNKELLTAARTFLAASRHPAVSNLLYGIVAILLFLGAFTILARSDEIGTTERGCTRGKMGACTRAKRTAEQGR